MNDMGAYVQTGGKKPERQQCKTDFMGGCHLL